jgi:hypothetical protein
MLQKQFKLVNLKFAKPCSGTRWHQTIYYKKGHHTGKSSHHDNIMAAGSFNSQGQDKHQFLNQPKHEQPCKEER